MPDYGADPKRYGGEKLARIVASGATKAYEEFNYSCRLCSENTLCARWGLAVTVGAGPATALFRRALPQGAGGTQGRVRASYGDAQTRGAGGAQDRARAGYGDAQKKKGAGGTQDR